MSRASMPEMPEQCFETLAEPGTPRQRSAAYADNNVRQSVKLGPPIKVDTARAVYPVIRFPLDPRSY
jgi:hypothetical protein